jgi:hypothetical protein
MLTGEAARARVRALRPRETAWLALVPCAVVAFVALMAVGPLMGHALFEPSAGEALWPPHFESTQGQPEPVKRGRYVVALLAPALLVTVVLLDAGRRWRLRPATVRGVAAVAQIALLAFVLAAVLGQSNRLLPYRRELLWPIFGVRSFVAAAAFALALLMAVRSDVLRRRVERASRETTALRIACAVAAAVLAAAWLLTAVVTDRTVGDLELMWWTMDDPFAILDGRTPLVDYHAFYAQLQPYLGAGALWLLGGTVLAFALAMVSFSLLALLATYAVMRRVVGGRSLLALMLFAPFLATGFLAIDTYPTPSEHPLGNAILFAIWPMRYGGAYLVAWLAARHLDGAAPRRAWLLFFVAGLVALDNLEFGVAAFAATLAAILCARGGWTRAALWRLAADAAVGLLSAAAAVAAITLVRAGALPRFGLLLEWPKVFGVLGLVAQPMPTLGFHLVLYATYVGAVVVAVVRRAEGEPRTLLTGMLAWSGVFGLLSAAYYVGRSDTLKLVALFSAWSFALVLLTIVVVERLAARPRRRPAPAELLVLLGFGLAICSLRELPGPGWEIARLRESRPPPTYQPAARRFLAAHTRPRERVTILLPLGHRTAYALGLENVSPYPFIEAIVTRRQFDTTIRTAKREGAHRLFLPVAITAPAQLAALRAAGFAPLAADGEFAAWSDDG